MCGRGEYLAVGNALDVMIDCCVHVGQGADAATGDRSRAGADRRRTFRGAAPATFQFVERRVQLAPLASRKKAPFQRVFQPVVLFSFATAGQFRSRPLNVQAVQDRVMPSAIIGAFANQAIELAPVVLRDVFSPSIEVAQNNAYAPKR